MVPRGSRRAAAAMIIGFALSGLGELPAKGMQPTEPRPLDTSGPITYFVANGSERSGFRASDRELALWALEAWQRVAGDRLRLLPEAESRALIRLYWAEHIGGRYTEMQPTRVEGRRGGAVFVPPDMLALGADVARDAAADPLLRESIVYLTCLHQIGHALGLTHSRQDGDLMYFFGDRQPIVEYFRQYRTRIRSRNDIAAVPGISEDDMGRLRAMYRDR